ncbi:MAG: alanine/ornithine racemase family PLP-dependent enzyme [Cetobacterium sp.]
MGYPKIIVNLKKIKHNAFIINKKCNDYGISVMGITKSFLADPIITQILVDSGIEFIGDSRIENLKKIEHIKIPKVLIRIPMISEAKDVVLISDISLNSEIKTIEALNSSSKLHNKIHKIILMIEMGDFREGILFNEIENILEKIKTLKHIDLIGVGTNFTCYGGIIPDGNKLKKFSEIVSFIENKLQKNLKIISGGNSSSLHLLGKVDFGKVNNLRIGEAIVLGQETAFGQKVKGCFQDTFILQAEIIELKLKENSLRAILALGKQDVDYEALIPLDGSIKVIGASSDHLIIDLSNSTTVYDIGDIINFRMGYFSLLRGMTSPYIKKELIY